ncbi:MAG TPA: hypothetical protein VMV81_14335 [Phycisphaerae bacterium]|nr:hypothetical protein [Phycisphaerae bacterium]
MKHGLCALVLALLVVVASGVTCELGPTLNITNAGYATAPQAPAPPGVSSPISFPVYAFPNNPPFFFTGAIGSTVFQPTQPVTAPTQP